MAEDMMLFLTVNGKPMRVPLEKALQLGLVKMQNTEEQSNQPSKEEQEK